MALARDTTSVIVVSLSLSRSCAETAAHPARQQPPLAAATVIVCARAAAIASSTPSLIPPPKPCMRATSRAVKTRPRCA